MVLKMLLWVFGTASVSQVAGFPLVRVAPRTSAEPPSTTAALPTSSTQQHLQRLYSSVRRSTISNDTSARLVAQGRSRSLSALFVQSSFSAKCLHFPHLKQQQQQQRTAVHRQSDGGVVAARGRIGGGGAGGAAGRTYQSPEQEGARRRRWPLSWVS